MSDLDNKKLSNIKTLPANLSRFSPKEQWKKNICYVNKYETVTDVDGEQTVVKTLKPVEVTVKEEKSDGLNEKKSLRLNESKEYVEAVIDKEEEELTEEELQVSTEIVDTYGDVEPVYLEDLEYNLKKEAKIGLGCPHGCGRFWWFKPSSDETMFVPKYEVPHVFSLNGERFFYCDLCGNRVILN